MGAFVNRFSVFTLLIFGLFSNHESGRSQETVDLRCDYRVKPLAVDRNDPLLSWRLEGDRQGLAQTAYQIQAATSIDGLDQADLWDSGWIEDSRSVAIEYSGQRPAAKKRVHWRVRIKDDAGTILPWSQPSWFDVGLTRDSDWKGAKWISCGRTLQPDYGPIDAMGDWIAAGQTPEQSNTVTYKLKFSLPDKKVVYAGTWWNHVENGSTELTVNGRKGVSGPEGPATIFYKDYSFYLQAENEVSIQLTDADAATPVCFGMQVVFADGSQQLIKTSEHWQVQIGDERKPAKVVCRYGKQPLGEAKISPRAPLAAAWYKKDFDVSKNVTSARLYVCGLGYNEPYLNGQKVGDEVLAPGQTDYQHFAHYSVFDVRDQIKPGANALSILLGDGWYNNDRTFSHSRLRYGNPGLRAYLDIRYKDGTNQQIVSDENWRWKQSGLTMSSVFLGDYFDYRKWHGPRQQSDKPADWQPVQVVKALSPKLIAQDFPPIRVVQEIEPVKTTQVGEKTWIVDLGQNISGWIGLEFDEPAGTVIRLRCVEMLTEDGQHLDNVPQSFWNCHASPQHHRIIADGKPHKWRPYFSYHGFRYAEIHGLSKAPTPGQIKGLVVNTDTPVTATFESSDPLLDRIFKMGIQTHLNNMHSILEDCPHREKCLWGGDAHSSWATGFYALDSASFYRQQVRLFLTPPFDPKGIPGRIGVGKRATNKTLDFTWSVSPLFLAWRNYQLNGDLQTADDFYDVMKRFLRYFEKKSPDLIPHIYRYGDHAAPIGISRAPQDPQLIAAFNFYAAAERFADFADALDKTDDATWSRDLADRIRASIRKKYYDSKLKTFGNGTHDSLALAFGIVDPAEQKAVAASLAKVYQENGKKFDGGFMSYFIYPQLTKYGYVDLALEMLRNPDYPGIAQSIRDYDATTIFERFNNQGRNQQMRQSLDHHAMNHPTAWMLNDLAGIRYQPNQPGGQRLVLAPSIPTDLQRVAASLKTAYGTIVSKWQQSDGEVTWSINIPPNCIAKTRPPRGIENLSIDGKAAESNESFNLKAGRYELKWTKANPVQAAEPQVGDPLVNDQPPQGFSKVFNGVNLDGWKGSSHWSVEQGALTGVADGTLKANQFIVWQGKPLKNFELRVMVRVTEGGNSGLQYRSKLRPDLGAHRLSGYQCDVVAKNPAYNGMLYEEQGRRILARNGKTVVIDTNGQPWITRAKPVAKFKPNQWHEYRILARGNHLQHFINGKQTADVIDLDEAGRSLEGVLAVQVHVGPPMKIQYKNFYLKRLPDDLPLVEKKDAPIPDNALQVKPQGRLPKNWKPVTYAEREKIAAQALQPRFHSPDNT